MCPWSKSGVDGLGGGRGDVAHRCHRGRPGSSGGEPRAMQGWHHLHPGRDHLHEDADVVPPGQCVDGLGLGQPVGTGAHGDR